MENADELVNATNEASLTTPNSGSTDSFSLKLDKLRLSLPPEKRKTLQLSKYIFTHQTLNPTNAVSSTKDSTANPVNKWSIWKGAKWPRISHCFCWKKEKKIKPKTSVKEITDENLIDVI